MDVQSIWQIRQQAEREQGKKIAEQTLERHKRKIGQRDSLREIMGARIKRLKDEAKNRALTDDETKELSNLSAQYYGEPR